jgi:hypothetical protein
MQTPSDVRLREFWRAKTRRRAAGRADPVGLLTPSMRAEVVDCGLWVLAVAARLAGLGLLESGAVLESC